MEKKTLKQWRENVKFWTYQELADKAGVSASTIWHIENDGQGRSYPSTKKKLCEALGLLPEQILEFSEFRPGVQTEAGE